jgi:hypothetical protein
MILQIRDSNECAKKVLDFKKAGMHQISNRFRHKYIVLRLSCNDKMILLELIAGSMINNVFLPNFSDAMRVIFTLSIGSRK